MLDCEYLVIGAGQTGMMVAFELLEKGKKLILVDQNKIGGSYLFTKEFPKYLLQEYSISFARSLSIFKEHTSTYQTLIDYRHKIHKQIAKSINQKSKEIEKKFHKFKNFQFVLGTAEFISKSLVEVNSESERHLINFKNCVIATGKDQLVKPPIEGIEEIDFLYHDNCFLFEFIPSQIALIGLSAETLEIASIYSNLGIKVNIVDKHKNLQEAFDGIDKSIINYLFKKLFAKEVELHLGFDVKEVKYNKKKEIVLKGEYQDTLTFPQIYLSIKESFSGKNLAISKIGIKSTKSGILTDMYGKTSHSHIYALGECSNQSNQLTKQFIIQEYLRRQFERTSLIKIIGKRKTSFTSSYFYVDAQNPIFSIGLSDDKATHLYGNSAKNLVLYSDYSDGFVKIVYRDINNKILGLSAAGDLCTQTKNLLLEAFQEGWDYRDLYSKLQIYLKSV